MTTMDASSGAQINPIVRGSQAYRDALADPTAKAPLGRPGPGYSFQAGPGAYADQAPAAPPRLSGTVAPTLPQNRPVPSAAPLADPLNQQRTASDSVPEAIAP